MMMRGRFKMVRGRFKYVRGRFKLVRGRFEDDEGSCKGWYCLLSGRSVNLEQYLVWPLDVVLMSFFDVTCCH